MALKTIALTNKNIYILQTHHLLTLFFRYKTEFRDETESYSEAFDTDDPTLPYRYPTYTTRTHTLVTDHQRRPDNDRFILSEKPVENRQSANLCKSKSDRNTCRR